MLLKLPDTNSSSVINCDSSTWVYSAVLRQYDDEGELNQVFLFQKIPNVHWSKNIYELELTAFCLTLKKFENYLYMLFTVFVDNQALSWMLHNHKRRRKYGSMISKFKFKICKIHLGSAANSVADFLSRADSSVEFHAFEDRVIWNMRGKVQTFSFINF